MIISQEALSLPLPFFFLSFVEMFGCLWWKFEICQCFFLVISVLVCCTKRLMGWFSLMFLSSDQSSRKARNQTEDGKEERNLKRFPCWLMWITIFVGFLWYFCNFLIQLDGSNLARVQPWFWQPPILIQVAWICIRSFVLCQNFSIISGAHLNDRPNFLLVYLGLRTRSFYACTPNFFIVTLN